MTTSNTPNRVEILKDKFNNSVGLPFCDLLPEATIQEALNSLEIKYRRRLFDPFVTLWAFLSQVLDADKSCHNAVSRVIAWLSAEKVEIPSQDTGAYCQARQRLPEKLLQQLFSKVALGLQCKVTPEYLWCGRHVVIVDGSTVSMPDTAKNQQAYPQPSSQLPGCGFPIAKVGVFFSLATGAAIAVVIDVLNTHDIKLARRLYDFLNPRDVLLGDRAFCSYADIVFVKDRQADVIFRKHQARFQELRNGKIVGAHDKQTVWHKPQTCPQGLTKEEFSTLPPTLTIREIYYYIAISGFRTQQVSLITTLLDQTAYSTINLVKLYGFRWDVELDLKHLKTTLGMDILRSKSPAMVRKEIYAYLLAYNLLRTLMWKAGTTYGVQPLRLSLQGTRQHLDNFIPQLLATSGNKCRRIYRTLLAMIVHKEVPERPGRSEPRVRKRRPKAYPVMQQPRCFLRQQMVKA